jgi:hypothetical protein
MEADLDAWLPDPQVRTAHRRTARVDDPDRLWRAAQAVRLREAPTLARIVRWRIPGTPRDPRFVELFARYPFTVLAEGERCSVSGLCGRVWTLRRDYPAIAGPDKFLEWDVPGTVRVLFAHWIEPEQGGRWVIASESRVQPVDRGAAVRLRALWTLVGRFERFIGAEALRAVVRRAEQG